jgi:hypothetical protein
MNEALASLMTAAALVGPPLPRTPVPPMAPAGCGSGETVVLDAPLSKIAAAQERAFVTRRLGAAPLAAAAAFDADGNLWFKFRQGDRTAAYSEEALRAGASADLPAGRATLKLDGDRLRAAAASGESAEFDRMKLVDALYAAAIRVKLGIQEYAALNEDGAPVPASLCLLRRDETGSYFVTHRSPGQMRETQWFMATGRRIYGMRLEGRKLLFVSQTSPEAARSR